MIKEEFPYILILQANLLLRSCSASAVPKVIPNGMLRNVCSFCGFESHLNLLRSASGLEMICRKAEVSEETPIKAKVLLKWF